MTDQPPSRHTEPRVAVVTGAARGIGRQAALALARQGTWIAGIDIAGPVSPILDYPPATAHDLAHTGDLVRQAGGRWLAVEADQRDIDTIRAAPTRSSTSSAAWTSSSPMPEFRRSSRSWR